MLPSEWQTVQRILVMRLDNIGDVVMLSPALRSLRQAFPQAEITLMVSKAGLQVTPLLPWIDDVLMLRAVWQDASNAMPLDPDREQELVQAIRDRRFDAVFLFTSFSQSPYPPAYIAYLAGIPLRVGQSKEFGGSLLSHWVKPLPDSAHQVDRNLFLLQSIGLPISGRQLELVVPDEVQLQSDRILAENGIKPQAPFIVMAPGASCAARRYDRDRFAQVAQMLTAQIDLPLVVVGSDREAELVAPILEHAPQAISLIGQTDVPQLAAVIRRSSLVIANNSGSLHIADAFDRPMVILYSGTEYESQWQPRFAPHQLFRRSTDCSPCYHFQCPYQMECLDIAPAEVATACLSLLKAIHPVQRTTTLAGI